MKSYKFLILLFSALSLLPLSGADGKQHLYPVLPECWKKGPLVKTNFSTPAGKFYGDEKFLAFEERMFRELKDPELRCTLIRELAQLGNPFLGKRFLPFFLKEEDPKCRKEFLNTMLQWSRKGLHIPAFPEKTLQKLISSGDPGEKGVFFALAFQANWQLQLGEILPHINWERDSYPIHILSANLPKLQGEKKAEGEKLLKRKENSARHFGLALLWEGTKAPDKEPLFREYLTGKDSLVSCLLLGKLAASSPKKAPELLTLLAGHKHPAVKLVLAKNMLPDTKEKEQILREFLGKENPISLRIESAKALGRGKDPASLLLLLETLQDPNSVLRRTARISLVKRVPPISFRKRMAEEVRKSPHAYMEGAAFFAALPEKTAAGPFLAGILKEKNHPEVMILHALEGLESIGEASYAPIAAAYSTSKSAAVRKACAKALGKMKNREVVPALKRLILDKNGEVAAQACETLWQWGESLPFAGEIGRILRSRTEDHSSARLGAIRCAERLPEARFKPLVKDLTTLLMKECIIVPQMPKSYDREEVRLSILFLFAGREGKNYQDLYKEAFAKLEKDASNPETGLQSSMLEFLRQIRDHKQGKKVIPSPVAPSTGVYSIMPFK